MGLEQLVQAQQHGRAASALPPPMPARLGMRLRMDRETPSSVMPQCSRKNWAAR